MRRFFLGAATVLAISIAACSGDIGDSGAAGAGAGTSSGSQTTTTSSGTSMSSSSTGMIGGACDPNRPAPTPQTGHPRLWVTADELPALQARATSSNPMFQSGIAALAAIYEAELSNPT